MKTLGKKRRGISGLMQVAMIVGIVIIFAGTLFAFAGDIFDVQTIADSVSLQRVTIHTVGGETFVSASVKNTGNTEITDISVRVMVDINSSTTGIQPFEAELDPSTLNPGMTGSSYAKMVDSNGADITLSTGQEVAVIIEATSTDGSKLTDPVTVRVR